MSLGSAFLVVATPDAAPAFRESLALVAVDGAEGSLGFLVNRPSPERLREALPRFGVVAPPELDRRAFAWRGGPTHTDAGWMLFDTRCAAPETLPEDSCVLADGVGVTASPSAAEALYAQGDVAHLLLMGHLSWEPGRLAAEMAGGSWLRAPIDPRLLFDVPVERRWSEGLCAALDLPRPWLTTGFAQA